MKSSLAVAYAMKRKGKKMAMGGGIHGSDSDRLYADGGSVSAGLPSQGSMASTQNDMRNAFNPKKRFADGGNVEEELNQDKPMAHDSLKDDLVDRIMKKMSPDYSSEDRYSEGGRVANETPITADFKPAEFDDLVLRDDLESSYGDDDNSGDALGNKSEDERRDDIVSRIMSSRRKKDKNPRPA